MAPLFALFVVLAARPAAADLEVVFLDQDANMANLVRLRAKMVGFLRTIDPDANFKAFSKLGDLKRYLAGHKVHCVLARGDAIASLGGGLQPVLVPLRDGESTYRKILVARKETDPGAIKVVATTSSPVEVAAIALDGHSPREPKLRVLRVSKGFDALLGMIFNRADAAYVTPETVQQLARVDAKMAASLQELYRSPPIPNPRLYIATANVTPALVKRIASAFRAMGASEVGRAALQVLNYTGWSEP